MATGNMLPLFSVFLFSIFRCYAANVSSYPDAPGLLLARAVDPRSIPILTDEFDGGLSQIFGRGISQDPSCPAGFLCVQQACPADIFCPVGQTCIDFEGTVACGVPGLQICALNPTTLEAVGCNGGQCCHGNCYTSDAVCCNFPSIQCSLGQLCNACNPGQTCGNNQCASPAPPPPSTTTISSSPPPPQPPPSSIASISKNTPTTTPTTTPTPTPTVVPSSGSFNNIGCYQDSPTARVLVAGSSADQSSTGMTVEKCVAFGQKGGFQYAGVEYGGECWVGNSLHGASSASQGDCNEACAGNKEELCGAGNRIQIYQDSTWFDPTAIDLANVLRQYIQSLTQAQTALIAYHSDIQSLQSALQASSQTFTETIEMQVIADNTQFSVVQSVLAQTAASSSRLFLTAASDDIVRPTTPLVDSIEMNELDTALSDAASAVSSAADSAEEAASDIAASTTNLIDFPAELSLAEAAIETVGAPAVAAVVATGVFLAIAGLLDLFDNPSNDNPPKTDEPPTTKPTSSSGCKTSTVQDCEIGCTITNFGDTSTTTNCYTTKCMTTSGCDVQATTTTTDTTTKLCPISSPAGTVWIPVVGMPLPFLGSDNIWTTPTPTSA